MQARDRPMDSIAALIRGLRAAYRTSPEPAVTQVAHEGDPFKVLVSCVLSLRTKDDVTAQASKRLFALVLQVPDRQVLRSGGRVAKSVEGT